MTSDAADHLHRASSSQPEPTLSSSALMYTREIKDQLCVAHSIALSGLVSAGTSHSAQIPLADGFGGSITMVLNLRFWRVCNNICADGLVVMILAFQASERDSISRRRMFLFFYLILTNFHSSFWMFRIFTESVQMVMLDTRCVGDTCSK